MHFFIWMGAIVTGNSLHLNVLYNVFPQVHLGEVPIKLEGLNITALGKFDILLG